MQQETATEGPGRLFIPVTSLLCVTEQWTGEYHYFFPRPLEDPAKPREFFSYIAFDHCPRRKNLSPISFIRKILILFFYYYLRQC